MNDAVLVTGGNGFLGSFVCVELLEKGCSTLFVLMRGSDAAECENRLRNLWWERPRLRDAVGKEIIPVVGDITLDDLGLSPADYAQLATRVRSIVHCAAEIGVNQTAERFGSTNVDGTANMLVFAHAAQRAGGIERFVHVSTAYVAGSRTGVILEDELVLSSFNSLYEQSKFGAEQLVREQMDVLPVTVVRPAQIVGDSLTGFAMAFNTLYYPLKLYLKGQLPAIPVSASMKVNMVPVDHVAKVVVGALESDRAVGKAFHAAVPRDLQPSVSELLGYVRNWSVEHLGFDPGAIRCVPLPGAQRAGRARNMAKSADQKKKSFVQNLLALAPYFSEDRSFDTRNVDELLGVQAPSWRDYLGTLLAFATSKGFMDHTGRTVFEQMLVRMQSRRFPIDYFDVSADGMRKTTGSEARETIMRAAHALRAHGIGHLDRVALVGVNSVRYFVADAAIGLAGATSVPLYYTLPAPDIADLVVRSQAKLVFVGTRSLLDTLPQQLDVAVVSLLDDPADEVESWEEFVEKGGAELRSGGQALPAPSYGDVATIRYTSGTTGKPKGVMFTHAQLRWMAETMPALLDWRTRTGKLRYLSFLPMSHVVEGILVSYAPYYLLSDVDMFYLNDFPRLADALPDVRPTLFFSVPRFYEKVWNQFEASGAGRRYLVTEDGPAKRALGTVAKAVLLRKAGLDKCRQLLVGSAPVGMGMLESFCRLGVEIHNAYGVTEAPLVALSRLGSNELGSVGDLLPDTQVRISGEGEILVAGPQVTVGYDGQGECVDGEGFFATGDFGSFSAQGKLVIGGRKKELLVTSYGKNISPEKVETLLKAVPGVSEALLVGEGKPYVGALLWLEDGASAFEGESFDAAVNRCNDKLSHPEQVKRWMVIGTPLSIAEGELTPNLKLRRRVVAQRYADAIEALYADDFEDVPIAYVMHKGAQVPCDS
ncbi:MAG: AMP-binding protein [Eggerthellaceae bacterium]|nr:AMP-binding protein [Eggerthellaceae bacterium]